MFSNTAHPATLEVKPVHESQLEENKAQDIVIELRHVTKKYHLYKNERGRALGLFGIKKKDSYLGSINANDDLSFEVYRGEAVALLGQNGAGKSTILKIISGVMYPTSGEATVNGRISALLELSAGFDGKLTGRENINLRGQAIGLSKKQIEALEPKAIEFADLGVYIDQPMRTYSSGMKARLGFGFAVSVDPEILIIDEVLSVGDRRFRKKCITRIREIMHDSNVTILFVTHGTEVAKEFCTRGIVLDNGRKLFDGSINDAVLFYDSLTDEKASGSKP